MCKKNPVKKRAKDFNREFLKAEIQMANKQRKNAKIINH